MIYLYKILKVEFMKKSLFLPLLVFLTTINCHAEDSDAWERILSNTKDDTTGQVGVLYDTNGVRTGSIYNARITYQFQGANGDGKFSSTEAALVTFTSSTGKEIKTSTYMTPSQLEEWANANASDILEAMFSNDPFATVSGSPSSASTLSEVLIEQVRETNRARHNKKESGFDTSFSTVIMMDSEKSKLKDKGNEGTSSAFRFSYDKALASGNDVGFLMSYKDIKSDDVYGSKSKKLLISPFYKYYYDVNNNFDVVGVVNGVVDLSYMRSSLFSEGFGYLEYGAGITALPNYYLTDKFTISFPIGVQTLKKNLNFDVPDNVKFIKSALNDIGFQTNLNYGMGLEYAIKDNWFVNTDVLKTQDIGSNKTTSKDKATYYSVRSAYRGESWDYVLGYKTVKDIDNFSEDAYMLSIQYNW